MPPNRCLHACHADLSPCFVEEVVQARHQEVYEGMLWAYPADKAVPWGTFMRSKPVWAIIMAHFAFNYFYYTLLAWLPSFFELSLGLNVESSSLLTLIPYLAMTAMTPFVGPIADSLVSKGWSITNVRKLAQVLLPPLGWQLLAVGRLHLAWFGACTTTTPFSLSLW
jgi:cyanate permease